MRRQRRCLRLLLVIACLCGLGLAGYGATTLARATSLPDAGYQSPYTLSYTFPAADLAVGFADTPWNDPQLQSSVPYAEWNSQRTPWGPHARQYPAPADLADQGTAWKQQRLVATATRFLGVNYQHHHIPAWDPPAGWPWEAVSLGYNSQGIDCSNFASFVYNYGLGIDLQTDIVTQSATLTNPGPGGQGTIEATRITNPGSYAQLVATLQTGDLLYINSTAGVVSHVIMWLGAVGSSPDGTPLVIDSHDNKPPITDVGGNVIPAGVEIRPFQVDSWYFGNFSHALRWLPTPTPAPSPTVTGFTPASGPVGTAVTLTGSGFTSVTAVAFNGFPATFSVDSATQITAVVPARATSGLISLLSNGGNGSTTKTFTVTGTPATTTTTTLPQPSVFPDVSTADPYYAAITDLAGRAIIGGFPDGTFRPDANVIRQQFAKMIVLTLDLPVSEADICPFTDVEMGGPGSLYPDNYVAVAAAHNITVGTSPGLFSPGSNITRAEVVTMVVRAAQNSASAALETPPPRYQGTLGDFDPTHAGNMKIAEYNELLVGLQDFGTAWAPFAFASRGEVAQILHNLLEKLHNHARVIASTDG